MRYSEMFDVIFKLPIGESVSIFDDGKTDLYVVRPSKIFKNYDIEKIFKFSFERGIESLDQII